MCTRYHTHTHNHPQTNAHVHRRCACVRVCTHRRAPVHGVVVAHRLPPKGSGSALWASRCARHCVRERHHPSTIHKPKPHVHRRCACARVRAYPRVPVHEWSTRRDAAEGKWFRSVREEPRRTAGNTLRHTCHNREVPAYPPCVAETTDGRRGKESRSPTAESTTGGHAAAAAVELRGGLCPPTAPASCGGGQGGWGRTRIEAIGIPFVMIGLRALCPTFWANLRMSISLADLLVG